MEDGLHFRKEKAIDPSPFFDAASDLYDVPRKGWLDRGVSEDKVESVGEHTAAMTQIFNEVIDKIDPDKKLDRMRMLKMIQIHDWPEGISGDEIAYHADPTVERDLKKIKKEKEIVAMRTICAKLGSKGEEIMDLWFEYENKSSREGQIINELDKVQAVIKAFEYQNAGEKKVSAQQFIDGYRKRGQILEQTFVDIINGIEIECNKLLK